MYARVCMNMDIYTDIYDIQLLADMGRKGWSTINIYTLYFPGRFHGQHGVSKGNNTMT